ncbi:MAG TPA: hypothetical protein VE130_00115, partial [Nitrososphaeraceae archaeon]|nr:hypothetical protein [Nitrososphaeraceae archaeon]
MEPERPELLRQIQKEEMKTSRNHKNGSNQGFSLTDQNYLRKYDNAGADPDIQLFTEEGLEDGEPEHRSYFCALCKSKLDHLQGIDDTIWRCNDCVVYYDTSIQDIP